MFCAIVVVEYPHRATLGRALASCFSIREVNNLIRTPPPTHPRLSPLPPLNVFWWKAHPFRSTRPVILGRSILTSLRLFVGVIAVNFN